MDQKKEQQNQNMPQEEQEVKRTGEIALDREKVDRALDFFLREQENAKEKERQREV